MLGIPITIAGLVLAHKMLKTKSVNKAKDELRKQIDPSGKFYISIPAERNWVDLQIRRNSGTFQTMLSKMHARVKTWGATNIQVIDSTEDTRFYFNLPRASWDQMQHEFRTHYKGLTFNEVKQSHLNPKY